MIACFLFDKFQHSWTVTDSFADEDDLIGREPADARSSVKRGPGPVAFFSLLAPPVVLDSYLIVCHGDVVPSFSCWSEEDFSNLSFCG